MSENIVRQELENGFKKYRRPVAAYVYLTICLFDFIAAPIFIEMRNSRVNTEAFTEIRQLNEESVQLKALEQLDLGRAEWQPLTLAGGGLFHVSFGAILGISA